MHALLIFSNLIAGLSIYVVLAGITICCILKSQQRGWRKAIWIAGVILIPVGGIGGYWWDRLLESRGEAIDKRRR